MVTMMEMTWTMSSKVTQMSLICKSRNKPATVATLTRTSISATQAQSKTPKSKNCCNSRFCNPQLAEKSGCLKLRELLTSLK